jgi:hypothetical protein
MRTERRSALKQLAGLPFLKLTGLSLFGKSMASTGNSGGMAQLSFEAVSIVRLVNTVQLWHRLEHGQYASWTELPTTDAFQRIRGDARLEAAGMGGTLASSLAFDAPEVRPGWAAKLVIDNDPSAYSFILKNVSEKGGPSFATDEKGIILTGKPLDSDLQEAACAAAELLDGAQPAIPTAPQGTTGRLKLFAQKLVSPDECREPCTNPPCLCCGACQEGPIGRQCSNCGCPACAWCCIPY